jgi:hypothetical protein
MNTGGRKFHATVFRDPAFAGMTMGDNALWTTLRRRDKGRGPSPPE